MRVRVGTLLKIAAVLVVALVAAVAAILKSVDFSQYKDLVAGKVEEATGRKLTIAGPVYLELFTLSPALAVDDVSFANATWGTRPQMVRLKRLEAQVALLPLLSKRVEVKRLVLVSPDIVLETDAKGQGNWVFGKAPEKAVPTAPSAGAPGALPVVNEIRIEDGTLTYVDGVTGKKTVLGLEKLTARAESTDTPLSISARGKYNENPFAVDGTLGALSELPAPRKPYPITISAEAGGAKVKVDGTIARPMEGKGVDMDLAVEGTTLADLGALAGASLPKLGPYAVAAHLGETDGGMKVERLKAALGKSDLSGDALLVQGKKPTLKGSFASKLVDLGELAAASPAAPAEKTEGPKTERAEGDGQLFSDAPLPLEGLSAANADVKLTVDKLLPPKGPEIGNLAVAMTLNDGLLTVKPLTANIVNGKLAVDASLDAREPQAGLAFNARATGLDLATLVREMKIDQKVDGKADFEGSAKGRGASVRAIMAGLDGHTDLTIGEMHVDNTLMKIVMADLAKAVVGKGDASKINCVVSRFDIAKGLATSKALVTDTDSVTIWGSGTVNLATEQLDLYLDPSPKAAAVVDLAIPVKITGTLASPSVAPDPAALAKKLGTAVGGVAGAVGGAGIGGAVLGEILGEKAAGGEPGMAPAAGGNPCLELIRAGAPKAGAGKPAATTKPAGAPASPAEKAIEAPGKTLEDIGKGIKGLFE
jgi:hypothetical protein